MIEQHHLPEEQSHEQTHESGHPNKPTELLNHVGVGLILILVFYGTLLCLGLPQKWTEMSNETFKIEQYKDTTNYDAEDHAAHAHTGEEHVDGEHAKHRPPMYMITPFVVLLLIIAFFPLIPKTAHWWENNTRKFCVATSLGVLTLLYYYLLCDFPVHQHWPGDSVVDPSGPGGASGFGIVKAVFINAIIYEFLPFVVLLFALFSITGGIRIESSLKATPLVNTGILALGAGIASFIGTTGAAALLIRPLLDMNRERENKVHTVIFFIFTVCNCGGVLTPLGDPPLLLGYLRGVAFGWPAMALWDVWAFTNVTLLLLYYCMDHFLLYPAESQQYRLKKDDLTRQLFTVSGWKLNGLLLLGVVGAVACLDPGRPVPGTDWHPWFYLREAIQLGLAAISLLFSSRLIRKENVFNFFAISEVAALFFGIFLCMQAPLQILNEEGKDLVLHAGKATNMKEDRLFFWSTAVLSVALDNAPTYLVFFEAARTVTPVTDAEKIEWRNRTGQLFNGVPIRGGYIDHNLLVAVTMGTILTGAVTYIANAPNFLVKSIAEQDGVKMPSFFGFMVYSFLIIVPLMVVVTYLFL